MAIKYFSTTYIQLSKRPTESSEYIQQPPDVELQIHSIAWWKARHFIAPPHERSVTDSNNQPTSTAPRVRLEDITKAITD
jgi:hypothetical protein